VGLIKQKQWWAVCLLSFAILYLLIIISLPLIYFSSLMALAMYGIIAASGYANVDTSAVPLAKLLLPLILILITAFMALLALIATKFVTRRYLFTRSIKARFLWLAAIFDFIIIPATLAIATNLIGITVVNLSGSPAPEILAVISLGLIAGHILSSHVSASVQPSSAPVPNR
jgi:hypothetical protein